MPRGAALPTFLHAIALAYSTALGICIRICEGGLKSRKVSFAEWERACWHQLQHKSLDLRPLMYLMKHHGCGCKDSPVQGFFSQFLCSQEHLVLEFGVASGSTLRNLAAWFCNKKVFGFDSFEGLPERWLNWEQGAFKVEGSLPDVGKNAELVVGMFKNSLPEWRKDHSQSVALIHIDCDLYSSTLFVLESLTQMLTLGTIIIFDELFVVDDVGKLTYWNNSNDTTGGELGALHSWSCTHPEFEWRWIGYGGFAFQHSAAFVITRLRPQGSTLALPRILSLAEAPASLPTSLASLGSLGGTPFCEEPIVSERQNMVIMDSSGEHWGLSCLRYCQQFPARWHAFQLLEIKSLCPGPLLVLGNQTGSQRGHRRWPARSIWNFTGLGHPRRQASALIRRLTNQQSQTPLCLTVDTTHVESVGEVLRSLRGRLMPGSLIVLAGLLKGFGFRTAPVQHMGVLGNLGAWTQANPDILWQWVGCDDRAAAALMITHNAAAESR